MTSCSMSPATWRGQAMMCQSAQEEEETKEEMQGGNRTRVIKNNTRFSEKEKENY